MEGAQLRKLKVYVMTVSQSMEEQPVAQFQILAVETAIDVAV
jgi:hypothetical protein